MGSVSTEVSPTYTLLHPDGLHLPCAWPPFVAVRVIIFFLVAHVAVVIFSRVFSVRAVIFSLVCV